MQYKLAIFDFDGTLANTLPFLVEVFGDVAKKHGLASTDGMNAQSIRQMTVRQALKQMKVPLWKLPAVSSSFIDLMSTNVSRISLFPQVEILLERLKRLNTIVCMVSSNSESNIRAVIGADLSKHFVKFECGMSMFGKAGRLSRICNQTQIHPSQAIYIGDQTTDAEAAFKAKMAFGAVTWGFESREVLQKVNPTLVFDSVLSIAEQLEKS